MYITQLHCEARSSPPTPFIWDHGACLWYLWPSPGSEEGVVHDYQVLHMNSWPCGPLNSEHERGGISPPSQLDSFHFPVTFMIGQWEEHNIEMGRYYIKQYSRNQTNGEVLKGFPQMAIKYFSVCLVIGFDL